MVAKRPPRGRRPTLTKPRSQTTAAQSPIGTLPDERLYERRPRFLSDPEVRIEATADDPHRDEEVNTQELLALARKRFQTASEAESTLRREMLEDLKFRAGEQWPQNVLADRVADKRPMLTINRLPQFIKQITNPERQARPALQINPVGDGADPDTAEVIQGLVRHIEHTSHAEVAYDEAYEDAVVMGRGWFRILTDYVDDNSFDQEIIVRRIANTFSVYVDPAAQELDYSDARYMFIVEDIPKDEYLDLYGDEDAQSLELFTAQGNQQADWFPEGKVRIAEYFYVEEVEQQIALIDAPKGDGMLVVPLQHVPKDMKPRKVRTVRKRVVHWAKINAARVLESRIWPGQWIPIVPVLGDEIDIDGRKDLVGIVRYARDPQRMYNYWVSAETETIALAPRAPFVGAEGQFKGHEAEWKQANTRNIAYLEYVPVALDGKPIAQPQRQQFEPPIRAIVEATKQADNDLKAVIGFYDASLGQPGPDQSGKAILARQKQGETANVNFIDNLARALWHAGRIYLDLIPKVYDSPRVISILGGDDQRKTVGINQEWAVQGIQKLYDVRVGRYAVTLSVGPSYQSRRQEAVASMLQLLQAEPMLIQYIGDLVVGEMDWPGAKQISERLKKMLPPQLQDDSENQQVPPQAQAQIAALQQQLTMLSEAYTKAVDLLKSKRVETASRERIAMLTTQATVAVAAMRYGSEKDREVLDREFQRFTQEIDTLHERMLAEDQREHELVMQAADAEAQKQQAAAQQKAQAAMKAQVPNAGGKNGASGTGVGA